ncbi:MAG: hypothetical protein P1P89_15805, partial [Desulfobacterales bacterium]|nr:hypothetical protein [Desulfobacterales bacterium]
MSEPLSRAELLEQKRSYWKKHIESWRSSGMTPTAYCCQHELTSHQFTYWKKRFIQTDIGVTFVPVKIRGFLSSVCGINSPTLLLTVDRDLKIEIRPDFDPGLLR